MHGKGAPASEISRELIAGKFDKRKYMEMSEGSSGLRNVTEENAETYLADFLGFRK